MFTDLGTLGGLGSIATYVNNSGQAVGYSYYNNLTEQTEAFLDTNDTLVPLGFLGTGTDSEAAGINSSGEIVGFSGTVPYGTPANMDGHAFLYSNGAMTDLGTLGGSFSYATAVNDSGEIVGYSSTAPNQTMDLNDHAFI